MHTVLIVAQSLDGFITRHDQPGTEWTSNADKKWFRECLSPFDASVLGRVTYETSRASFLKQLDTSRSRVVMTRSPERFQADAQPPALVFTSESAKQIVQRLTAEGRKHCAILGGTQVHDAFFQAGLVDEMWTTVEPRIFGAGTALCAVPHDVKLRLDRHDRLPDSDSVLLRYHVLK
jgi:dihydrofolate reductase